MPRFITDDERAYFIVEFPIHPDFLPDNILEEKGSEKKSEKIPGVPPVKDLKKKQGSEKNYEKGSEKKPNDNSNKILILIQNTPTLTIRELSEELGISTRAVEKHINSLKKLKQLKRMGSRRNGWWKVTHQTDFKRE